MQEFKIISQIPPYIIKTFILNNKRNLIYKKETYVSDTVLQQSKMLHFVKEID